MAKILVFSDEYPPAGGGAGIVARQLLRDYVHAGHSVTLLSGDEAPADADALRHHRVMRRTLTWPLTYRLALGAIDLRAFDCIVLNDVTAAYIAGLWFPRSALRCCVVVVHGADSRFVYQFGDLRKKVFRYPAVYSRTLRNCKKTVAVSHHSRQRFLDNLPETLRALPVEACYPGIAMAEFTMDPGDLNASELGIPAAATVLFSASRLVADKGLLTQLDIFERAIGAGANYAWLIAGDGPLRAELQRRIASAGLGTRVRLLGKLPRSELSRYYAYADIFWLLSQSRYESLPLVYLEAAACGTPSLAVDIPGVNESVIPGRNGFFINDQAMSGTGLQDKVKQCLKELKAEDCRAFALSRTSGKFAEFLLAPPVD